MNSKERSLSNDAEADTTARLFKDYLGVNFDDLILSCFLEQSARYLGVFYEQDPHQERDDKYLIN